MLWGVLQTLLISIGIIWGIHLLIQYLQETYTVKKNKDMLSIVTTKYEKMLDDVVARRQQATPEEPEPRESREEEEEEVAATNLI